MRKMALLLALWFCFSAWATDSSSLNGNPVEDTVIETKGVFALPTTLKEIGESAFEGTAAETVNIQSSMEMIGDRAFANMKVLKVVHIPKSVKSIGEHAFEGSFNAVIHCIENSYAALWARAHNVAFVREAATSTWILKLGKLLQGSFFRTLFLCCLSPGKQFWQRRKTEKHERSMRPQDRPELYPIDYRFP
jgi:hypothetical protein